MERALVGCQASLSAAAQSPCLACLGALLFALGGATYAAWAQSSGSGLFGCGRRSPAAPAAPGKPAAQPSGKPFGRSPSANRVGPAAEWVEAIEQAPGVELLLDADMLLADSHPILGDDHMFSAFVQYGLLVDLTGYYDRQQRRFFAVVSTGRSATAGHPGILHGGLTAALVDESLGGLMFALIKHGALESKGPWFTAQLNVSYKRKIDAGAAVLCTTEVESLEGRKLWMKAVVSDGPEGAVYATARALFVAPKPKEQAAAA